MDAIIPAEPKDDIEAEALIRSFVSALDEEEYAQFKLILAKFSDEYPQISPIQRGMLGVAFLIQSYLLAEGYKSAKSGEKMSREKAELLEWSRKTYDSNVTAILQKQQAVARTGTFVETLKDFMTNHSTQQKARAGVLAEEAFFKRKFPKIELEDVETRARAAQSFDESDFPAPKSGSTPEEAEIASPPRERSAKSRVEILF